jgi:hypothetical protein
MICVAFNGKTTGQQWSPMRIATLSERGNEVEGISENKMSIPECILPSIWIIYPALPSTSPAAGKQSNLVAWERIAPRAPAYKDTRASPNRDLFPPNDPFRGLQAFLFSIPVLSMV